MGILKGVSKRLKDSGHLDGLRVGMALHVEAKTACLALTLQDVGARVVLTGCNPLSTQDDVADALREEFSLQTFAKHGVDNKGYYEHLHAVVNHKPQVAIDDGGDLTLLLHEQKDRLRGLRGICEETTTGVVRAHAMHEAGKLKVPLIDINGAQMKHLFDNRYGTGQSSLDGIMRATNLTLAGRGFLVVGYGWCGRGIAMRARGMGARVLVTEVDPIRAVEAYFDGFEIGNLKDLLPKADFVVTATGNTHVIAKPHLDYLKDGVVLANAGHFNVEIPPNVFERAAKRVKPKRDHLTEYVLPDNRRAYLVAGGRLVNLAVGDGHPVEVMDASFGVQALCADHLASKPNLRPGVHRVPADLDEIVARLALDSYGVRLYRLTKKQQTYMASFAHGT